MSQHTHDGFDHDVVVAGGGPAGSTAATLLAQQGHRVLLLERDRHPRFHIGESMLPLSEPVVQRLGIDWSLNNQFKSGALFMDEASGQQIYFPLSGQRRTYQAERAPFDEMLFRNAASHGAVAREKERVEDVKCMAEGVEIATNRGSYRARYLVDATGRSALMGRKTGAVVRIDNLGRFAVYTRYRDIPPGEEADELFRTGNIYIPVVDIGWIWIIPLSGRRLSVGLVVQKGRSDGSVEALYRRYISQSMVLNRLLAGAAQDAPIRTEADFSYTNQRRYGLRYACCGDAAGFLDPVFSSGVFLAFTSAARIADRIHLALLDGSEADPSLHLADDSEYLLGFNTMRVFVERFYQSDMVRNLFFEADKHPTLRDEIAQLLAGDLWSGNNPLQKSLLASHRSMS
ncbi:MAG: NAD(P)/FAD-dependent oxidoreductase [Proteobacteria bacterium]|nr:NAD(P)/FAD-dependent oxidoreductase [Pseudomonadota bacterium]